MKRLLVLCLVLAGCPGPRNPASLQFWSLVKVEADGSSHAMKCLHSQEGTSILVRCFTPVEIPLFDVAIEGNSVTTTAASEAVAARIPFDMGRIGADIWRVHVAGSAADVASYNGLCDPDLPEDEVVITTDGAGRPTHKSFEKDGSPIAEAAFHDWGENHAARIVFTSHDPAYTLTIVQGGLD